jgi:hypothetical protein
MEGRVIFAKVDVELLTHPRVLRIPKGMRAECVGVWTLALLYSRRHELDGFCPLEAIDQVARDKAVDQLVAVGLVSRDVHDGVHGIRILRYSDRNETREEIARRKESDRKRKWKPPGIQPDSDRNPKGIRAQGIPDSDSDSDSDSDLDLRAQRINPPAQSFQDSKSEPTSGVLRAADVLRTGENENRRPRKDPDIVAKAIAETQRLERVMGGGK